jgi:hypothetical protein
MVAALQSLTPPARRELQREYVASGGILSQRLGTVISDLFSDDAELAIGRGGFEQLLTDPEVLKDVTVLVDAILGDGVQLFPLYTDEESDKERARLSAEYAELCRMCLYDTPRKPFKSTLAEQVRAAYVTGHKMAEITFRDATSDTGAPLLVLDTLKLKPRGACQFVVDPFMNVLGIQVWTNEGRRIISREKFFILSFEQRDEDPRGSAPAMRAAYNWWVAKRAALPVSLKRLEKKAIPSVVGFTAENESGYQDEGHGGTATEKMAASLAALDHQTAAAFPAGADAKVLDTSGDGSEFDLFIRMCNRELANAILLQNLATNEGQYGTRAQATVAWDVLAIRIWHLKNIVADDVRRQLCRLFVRVNHGEEAAQLTPVVSLGDSDRKDWAVDARAAALLAPLLTDSQWASLVKMLGLPMPEEGEEWPARTRQAPQQSPDREAGESMAALAPAGISRMTSGEVAALHRNLASSIRSVERIQSHAGRAA